MLRRIPFLWLCAALACSSKPEPVASPAGASRPQALGDATDTKALLAEVDKLSGQLKDKPKTFEVLAALGNLYYENNRFLDAVDSFRQALQLSGPAESQAAALRKAGTKPANDLPLECRRSGPGYGLEQILVAAKSLDAPHRLKCLESAVEPALAVRARRANALYLVGNPDGALAEHRKLLEQYPDYPESLFFVGAVTLEESKGDKEKLDQLGKLTRNDFGARTSDKEALFKLGKAESLGEQIAWAFETFSEPMLPRDRPSFVVDFPIEISPLARKRDGEPRLVDRFEAFAGGFEIANAFTELNDPRDQEARFRAQVEAAKRGNEEAMPYDRDFVRALEHGMPPTAGEGIGIDRLVMLFTDSPGIRDVVLFPLLRPEAEGT